MSVKIKTKPSRRNWLKLFDGEKYNCHMCSFSTIKCSTSDIIRYHYNKMHPDLLPKDSINNYSIDLESIKKAPIYVATKHDNEETADLKDDNPVGKTSFNLEPIKKSNFYSKSTKNLSSNVRNIKSAEENQVIEIIKEIERESMDDNTANSENGEDKSVTINDESNYILKRQRIHWDTLLKKGIYHCGHCSFISACRSAATIREHYKQFHPIELLKLRSAKLKCKAFKSKTIKKENDRLKSSNTGKIKCHFCNKSYNTIETYRAHLKFHFKKWDHLFKMDHFKCDRCDYISRSMKYKDIQSHYLKFHFKMPFVVTTTTPENDFTMSNKSLKKVKNRSSKIEVKILRKKPFKNKDRPASDETLSDLQIAASVKFITRWIKSAICSGKIFISFNDLIEAILSEMIGSPLTNHEIYVIVAISHLININLIGRIPHISQPHYLGDDFYNRLNHTCFWLREFLEGPLDNRPKIWAQFEEDKKFGPLLDGREGKIALHSALQFFPQRLNSFFTTNLDEQVVTLSNNFDSPLVPSLSLLQFETVDSYSNVKNEAASSDEILMK